MTAAGSTAIGGSWAVFATAGLLSPESVNADGGKRGGCE